MKHRNVFIASSSVILLGLILSGCSSNQVSATPQGTTGTTPTKKQSVTLDILTEPPTLDPAKATDTTSAWVMNQVMEGLTYLGADHKPMPGIAESWTITNNSTVYTFKLRDAKWSNGDSVTADDFVYEIKHLLDPKTAAQFANYLYYIKGAKEYNTSKGTADGVAIKAIDAHTLEITLNNPVPFFLQLTSFYAYFPVDHKIAEQNPSWPAQADSYVGNGPFKLVTWKHQEKLVLEKNPNYWNQNQIHLNQVNALIVNDSNTQYQMYKSGQLDMDTQPPLDLVPKLIKSGEATVLPYAGTYFLEMNTQKPPFNNVNIRKAFALAIDQNSIVNDVLQGGQKPAFGLVPPGVPGKSGEFRTEAGDLFKSDPAQAKQLLAKGLQELGLTKLPPITYEYNTLESNKKIAEAVQQMFKKNLDVDVSIQNEEWKVYLDKLSKGNYQIGRLGWIESYTDPSATLDLMKSNFGSNYARYKNEKYDQLVNEAEATTDVSKRMEDMHQAEQILMDDMPLAPVYFYTNVYAFNKKLDGIVVHPSQSFPDMRYMSVK